MTLTYGLLLTLVTIVFIYTYKVRFKKVSANKVKHRQLKKKLAEREATLQSNTLELDYKSVELRVEISKLEPYTYIDLDERLKYLEVVKKCLVVAWGVWSIFAIILT